MLVFTRKIKIQGCKDKYRVVSYQTDFPPIYINENRFSLKIGLKLRGLHPIKLKMGQISDIFYINYNCG